MIFAIPTTNKSIAISGRNNIGAINPGLHLQTLFIYPIPMFCLHFIEFAVTVSNASGLYCDRYLLFKSPLLPTAAKNCSVLLARNCVLSVATTLWNRLAILLICLCFVCCPYYISYTLDISNKSYFKNKNKLCIFTLN